MSAVGAAGGQDAVVQRMLMQQLTAQLAQDALPSDDAGTEQVRSLFAQTLADAVSGSASTASSGAAGTGAGSR